MFTVKVTYTSHGQPVTDLSECEHPRVTHFKTGGTAVYLQGGNSDGASFFIGPGRAPGPALHAHTIVIENAAGKTTEIFRDHRDIMEWRKDMEAQKTAEAA